jgi:hypothetical protein
MKWLPAAAGLALLLAFASFLSATAEAWTGGCGYPSAYYAPGPVYYGAYYAGPVVRPVVRHYRVPVVVPRPVYRVSAYPYGVYSPYPYGAYYTRGPSGFFYRGW